MGGSEESNPPNISHMTDSEEESEGFSRAEESDEATVETPGEATVEDSEPYECHCAPNSEEFPTYQAIGYPDTCYACLSTIKDAKIRFHVPDLNGFLTQYKQFRKCMKDQGLIMGHKNEMELEKKTEVYEIENGFDQQVFDDTISLKAYCDQIISSLRDTYAWHRCGKKMHISADGTKKTVYYTCHRVKRIQDLKRNDKLRAHKSPRATKKTYSNIQHVVYSSNTDSCEGALRITFDSLAKRIQITQKHIDHEYEQLYKLPSGAADRILKKLADSPLKITGSSAAMFRDGLFPDVTRAQLD